MSARGLPLPARAMHRAVGNLPAGALGAWYADQVVTVGGNAVVPNYFSAVPVSANLLRLPRRMFSGSVSWGTPSAVVVDNNVVGPDGLTQASTVTGTGDWAVRFAAAGLTQLLWSAGTYTIACNVKRATGSDQSFQLDDALGAFTSGTLVATSAWQRFAYTFTLGSPTTMVIEIGSFDHATGATIAICDFEMFAGSSDLGPEVLDGHMYLGGTPTIGAPTFGGGYVDFTVGSVLATLQFKIPPTLTTGTISAVINRTATGNASLRQVLSEINHAGDIFALHDAFSLIGGNDSAAIQWGVTAEAGQTGLWNQSGAGPHIITWRYNGTTLDIFLDDVIVITGSHPGLASITLANLLVMYNEVSGGNAGDKLGALAIWSRDLSNEEIYNAIDSFTAHLSSSYAITPHKYYYFADGDSITFGSGGVTGYPFVYGPLASKLVFGHSFAVGGEILSGVTARLSQQQSLLPPLSRQGGRHFVFSVDIGTNDLGTITGAVVAADLGNNYVDPMQSVGWTVLTGTMIDRTGAGNGPTWITNALAFNAIITGSWGHGSGFIDFAANANLGPPGSGAANNLTYFQGDNVHPTQTGENLMETIMKPVIDGILNS